MSGLSESKPGLIVHSTTPLNAEPPLDRLRSSFVTSTADFYIRSHGAIPIIDTTTHRLRVTGAVRKTLDLGIADLTSGFEPRTVTAVLQCAGNRRADLQPVAPTSGDPWQAGAIGHAAWTGVPLIAVLRAAGARENENLHVAFEALDIAENEGAANAPYGASIPMRKAQDEDVLLAWAMNGTPLAPAHGAPLRIVVPGFAGARSPKWVREIRVQDTPSNAFQQARDYLLFPPDMRKETQDLARGTPIYDMPLTSAICEPPSGAVLSAGKTAVRGYAIATDRAIIRVDVSANGGHTWQQATIEDHGNARWSWTLWHTVLDLAAGQHELAVRGWDAAGQTQPATAAEVWNFKGYLSTAWHRVPVTAR